MNECIYYFSKHVMSWHECINDKNLEIRKPLKQLLGQEHDGTTFWYVNISGQFVKKQK